VRDAAVVRRCMNIKGASDDRSHALRGNASRDAPRPFLEPNAERPLRHSHAERGNDQQWDYLPSFTLVQPRVMIRCTAIGWSGTAYKVAITASGGYEPGSLRIASSTNGVAAEFALL
jgi:hypothetical protein